jgi:dienelactone hydrolase
LLKAIAASSCTGFLGCAGQSRVIARDIRAQGLVGTLFLPEGSGPFPAVITLTGAGGGIEEPPAYALAREGFAAFALATHGMPGLPPRFRDIPIEYGEHAIGWLRMTVRPAGDFIGVRGWSRGGELALILGAMFPSIRAVLAYAPLTYVGLSLPRYDDARDLSTPAAWTWQGEPLAFAPLPRAMMADPRRPTLEDRFGIPIERTRGPILFVTGTEDRGLLRDPTVDCDRAMRRLDLFHFPHHHDHWSYVGAGHDIEGPPPYEGHAEGGGTVAADRRAVADSWPRSIAFLRAAVSAAKIE